MTACADARLYQHTGARVIVPTRKRTFSWCRFLWWSLALRPKALRSYSASSWGARASFFRFRSKWSSRKPCLDDTCGWIMRHSNTVRLFQQWPQDKDEKMGGGAEPLPCELNVVSLRHDCGAAGSRLHGGRSPPTPDPHPASAVPPRAPAPEPYQGTCLLFQRGAKTICLLPLGLPQNHHTLPRCQPQFASLS